MASIRAAAPVGVVAARPSAGYRMLLEWARGFGAIERAGVEGTGSYGAALTRLLRSEGRLRRGAGKERVTRGNVAIAAGGDRAV